MADASLVQFGKHRILLIQLRCDSSEAPPFIIMAAVVVHPLVDDILPVDALEGGFHAQKALGSNHCEFLLLLTHPEVLPFPLVPTTSQISPIAGALRGA